MRMSRDEWGLRLAEVTAQRSTCLRRSVGCVLTDKHGHVLATGYNGVAAGQPHCNQLAVEYIAELGTNFSHLKETMGKYPHACSGAMSPSGTNLDGCLAIHAEQNALLQCRDVQAIHTTYVTCTPCVTCLKLLLNTSCELIVSKTLYSHKESLELWLKGGRRWIVTEQS